MTLIIQQHVVGRDVPMDHPTTVGVRQRPADGLDQLDGGIGGQRTLPQEMLEIAASQIGHHQVGTFRVPPEVEQRNDMGVLQRRDQLRFHLKAADEPGPVGDVGVDRLYRHLAAHTRLRRPPHHTMRSLTD